MISSRLAKRYAKALFSLGQEDGKFEQYGLEVKEFVELCRENEDFRAVLVNPVFPLEERRRLLQEVLDKAGFSNVVKNFFNILLQKKRMKAVDEIAGYYERLWDEALGISRAKIITARPLKEDALKALEKALEELYSRKIKSEVEEDQSLIGGVVVKIGDVVLDGSVKAQLEGLRESLKRGEIN
ncbi:MAG: F0F1 ATP synthase subunit delta [Desulfobacteraceae bacterium]